MLFLKTTKERFEKLKEVRIRPLILRCSIRHVHGAQDIPYTLEELIVLCVVRNGEMHVKSFIEHHLALGVKHIVLLDNGSTDDTIAIAKRYPHVTILSTKCPYRVFETHMKHYLVRRFSRLRWSLFADIDELFDYPFSDVLSLKMLLAYLNAHSYTAVVTQMLDMFSEHSLGQQHSDKEDSVREIYTYYDASNIHSYGEYNFGTLSNKEVKFHYGGIRKTLFGTDNGLTKAALILLSDELVPFVGWHHVANARIADFTCVLLHYPFVGSFREKVREAVESDRYGCTCASREYLKYWEGLKDTDIVLKLETASKFVDVNSLVQSGFLVVSEAYRRWVALYGGGNSDFEATRN